MSFSAWQLILAGFTALLAFVTVCVLYGQARALKEQVRMLRATVQTSVYQGLNSNFLMIDRIGIEHPDLARAMFRPLEGKSDDEVRQLMAADLVLEHLDSVFMQEANIPPHHFTLWRNTAELLLRQMPVLHEWIDATPGVWSDKLKKIAHQCRPAAESETA